ncbi:hypothetical protein CRUP_023206 [Coryphaenoides rupestris]|nr:hypothetical protein CRUP_023206 [Coryphaenoides rupestris]
MSVKGGVRPDEGLLMMQELEDRLKEQIDKLEHVRLASAELKDTLSMNNEDLSQSIADHLDWGRNHLADDAQSEMGWPSMRGRRDSDAASEMSCNW